MLASAELGGLGAGSQPGNPRLKNLRPTTRADLVMVLPRSGNQDPLDHLRLLKLPNDRADRRLANARPSPSPDRLVRRLHTVNQP